MDNVVDFTGRVELAQYLMLKKLVSVRANTLPTTSGEPLRIS